MSTYFYEEFSIVSSTPYKVRTRRKQALNNYTKFVHANRNAIEGKLQSYLSITTGSEGVSFRFPQDFFSQHRLKERKECIIIGDEAAASGTIIDHFYTTKNILAVCIFRSHKFNYCPTTAARMAATDSTWVNR